MGTATGDIPALRLTPPSYCQYVGEGCDQSFSECRKPQVFFAYPSSPPVVASTIIHAIAALKQSNPRVQWLSWQDMDIQGQMIYCQLCSAMRTSAVLVADVSTLNFNVMFEIGYAIGLGLPIFPIRDTSIGTDKRAFRDIGVLDTLGYLDFVNSQDLLAGLANVLDTAALPEIPSREYRNQPIYLLKSPIAVDGSISLQATLKKARLGYRSFDPVETPRLSLHDARRQVAGSAGVVADLIDPGRERADVHNARAALVCGMAMAQERAVLMLQEELTQHAQPLDYRDVVKSYQNSGNVPGLMRRS